MATDFGTGVSRTLDAVKRQFSAVVFQKGKPPLDSEVNLLSQMEWESLRQVVRNMMPSGFIMDPTRANADYLCNPQFSNRFALGVPREPLGLLESAEKDAVLWANVNGWIIPVVGSGAIPSPDWAGNIVDLMAPPETDARIDFVFLEAWQARIDPNASTKNKPSASTIWKYGNVQFGGTNLVDDLQDPTIGYRTTARIQVQYRLRAYGSGVGMGTSVALDVYPDGLGAPTIYGQGTAVTPIAGMGAFTNMRAELGDPSLWRAGNGDPNNDYGTVDGYVYAIPVCAVFRRGSNQYVAVNQAGNPTQNGAFDRRPSAKTAPNPSSVFLSNNFSLNAPLAPTAGLSGDFVVAVSNLSGSGLDDPAHILANVFLVLNNEIVGVSAINVGGNTITIRGRGRFGTAPVGHAQSTPIQFYNPRTDGLFADEIAFQDILDLRHAVNAQDWDYNRLLSHNVSELVKGTLRSTWKQSATGNTQGTVVQEVDYLYAGNGALVPNYTYPVDGTDGVRTVWSDAAAIQPEVTMLLDNNAVQTNGVVDDTFETLVAWDVSPGFRASGWMNNWSSNPNTFTDGSVIFLYTGGSDGTQGARKTFRTPGTKGVRLLTPREYWKTGYPTMVPDTGMQTPVTMRFLGERAFDPAPDNLSGTPTGGFPAFEDRHAGPMYPVRETNFERPFIVLGGILNDALKVTVPNANLTTPYYLEIDMGINFDTPNAWFTGSAGEMDVDPTPTLSNPLFHGLKTLYGMLTDGGRDSTGASSEVYVVVYGDKDSKDNNGAFRVIGAGTAASGYTSIHAHSATSIVVQPLSVEVGGGGWDATANTVTVEFRSQYTHAEDTSSYDTKWADVAIVMTDLCGQNPTIDTPWLRNALGAGSGDGYDLSLPRAGGSGTYPIVAAKMVLSTTLQYHPGHGATARVPDQIVHFARTKSSPSDGRYLRQCPATLDPSFPPGPSDEIVWPTNHVQLWNRLPALGLHAPIAPNYGGNVVGYTEQDREHELFVDPGSKTIIFRPFRSRDMTLNAVTFSASGAFTGLNGGCLLGSYAYPAPHGTVHKDDLELFTGTASTGKLMGLAVPPEFMPRFGRQDIPFHQYDGESPLVTMPGINHLFRDSADITNPVFNIIGGAPTTLGTAAVNHMVFLTADPSDLPPGTVVYGKAGTSSAGTNAQPFLGARLTTDISQFTAFGPEVLDRLLAVNSSDFGRGLRGIQLPPYYGPARVYGVYDIRDFVTKTGHTISPTNRVAPDGGDPAPNLLRQDADRQTLFILQDGAKDWTGESGDHTYIIPENVLDLSRSLNWDPAHPQDFATFDFVVVCSVFGFAKDWINGNNYVLVRKFNGQGVLNADGDNNQLESVPMVIPCAAAADEFYIAYNRTAYQGDVFMSRNNVSTTASDYQVRYGQLTTAQQYAMRLPIQQYDSNGVYVPQTPNPRAFEVLASMDFYTTMGTGKIGGQIYPGTPLDVGYVENTPNAALRKPDTGTDPMWQVFPRTFTEGQKTSTNRARLDLTINSNILLDTSATNTTDKKAFIKFKLLDGSIVRVWFTRSISYPSMSALYTNPNTDVIVPIDETTKPIEFKGTYTFGATTLKPGYAIAPVSVNIPGVRVGDSVLVNNAVTQLAGVTFVTRGRVTSTDHVTIEAMNVVTPTAFEMLGVDNDQTAFVDQASGSVTLAAGNSTSIGPFTLTGLDRLKNPVLVASLIDPTNDLYGLVFTAIVDTADNQYHIQIHNTSSVDVAGWSDTLRVVAFEPLGTSFTQVLTGQVLDIRVFQTPYIPTDFSNQAASAFSSLEALAQTVENVRLVIGQHQLLSKSFTVKTTATNILSLEAIPTGAEGNAIQVTVGHTDLLMLGDVTSILQLNVPHSNDQANANSLSITSAHFYGGEDIPMNAGPGTSQVKLTGMTERLPTGALIQDSDFLCENPLVDSSSAMKSSPVGPRALQSIIPLTNGGDEYTRFFGAPGEVIAQSDGAVMTTTFGAWRRDNLTGSRVFRLYRGGGPLYVLSGDNPGGPVDWVSESFPAAITPVLKGGILVCRAMLVRNFYEEKSGPVKMSDGDEIQMVIATYGMMGDTNLGQHGMTLAGAISPAGYGEGYAAADRYRLHGRPMFKGVNRTQPDPSQVVLAVYPDKMR